MVEPSRWERLLEQKPVPILEHLLDEVAQLFANELKAWPPRLEAADAQVAALLEAWPAAPDARVYREAFRLTAWDLARDLDAYDDYLRNQRWQEAGLPAKDKPMLLFLSRYMAEQLLAFGEATQGRVKRARLVDLLERTQRRFEGGGR